MKAYVFPGQGAQFSGMGKDLYENSELAKELFDKANEILGFDIKSIMFEDSKDSSGIEILSIKKFVSTLGYVGPYLYRIKKTVLVNSVKYKDAFISVIKVKDLYIQIIGNSNKTLSLSPFFIFNKETNTCLIFRDNYNADLMKHFLLQHEGSKGLESNINIIYI